MHYYTYPVQLNQKEMKRGLITICQCFRFHRFWGLWHYSKIAKDSEINILLLINKKVHCLEISHPSITPDPVLEQWLGSGKKTIWVQSHSCGHIPFPGFSGPNTSRDALQLRNKTAEVLALSSEVRTIYQDSIPGCSCAPGGWDCTQPNVKGCWSTRDSLSFTKTSDLDFQVLQRITVSVMDCHIQTFWVWQEHTSATSSTLHFFLLILVL